MGDFFIQSRSETYKNNLIAGFSDGEDNALEVIDYSTITYVESNENTPSLFLNFENGVEIENLWFKCSPNVTRYSLFVDGESIFENRQTSRVIEEIENPEELRPDLDGINYAFGLRQSMVSNLVWILDSSLRRVDAYETDGVINLSNRFDLNANNRSPSRMAYGDSKFFVIDNSDLGVYIYNNDGAYDSLFSLHSDNGDPRGITYYNNRLWIPNVEITTMTESQRRFFISDSFQNKVFFYDESDNLVTEFVLSFSPEGIVINDNEFYIIDADERRIRTFNLSGVSTNDDFNLHSTNLNPFGITYFDDRFWVVDVTTSDVEVTEDTDIFLVTDSTDNHIYAYDGDGNRFSNLEIDLNFSPEGITYYNNRIYVLDSSDNQILIFDTSGEPIGDFDLYSLNLNPFGITYFDDRLWVVDVTTRDVEVTEDRDIFWIADRASNRLYAYDGEGNRYTEFEVALSFSPEGVTFYDDKLWVLDNNGSRLVAYSISGEPTDGTFDLHTDNANALGVTYHDNHFYIVNLDVFTTTTTETIYWVYDDLNGRLYAYTSEGDTISSHNFNLHADNSDVEDLTYFGNNIFVLDSSDSKFYRYNIDGERQGDFNLVAENDNPLAATASDNTIYVANVTPAVLGSGSVERLYSYDNAVDRLYAYELSDIDGISPSITNIDSEGFDVDVEGSGENIRGVVYHDRHLYFVNRTGRCIHAFDLSGNEVASRRFDLTSDNANAEGITFGSNRFWVTDNSDDRIYSYSETGVFQNSFALDPLNNDSRGITFYDDKVWVVDEDSDMIFGYSLTGTHDTDDRINLVTGNNIPRSIAYGDGYFFVYETFFDEFYIYDADSMVLATLVSPSFILDGQQGLTYRNDMNVTTPASAKIYGYTGAGLGNSSADFDLDSNNFSPISMTYGRDEIWVLDDTDNKVFVYNTSGVLQNEYDVHSDNGSPRGIFYIERDAEEESDVILITDDIDNKVYGYNPSNFSRNVDADFDLSGGNSAGYGIIVGGTNTEITTTRESKVFAYDTDGNNVEGNDFELSSIISHPGGIAYGGGHFQILDTNDNNVYGYTEGESLTVGNLNSSNTDGKGLYRFDRKYWVVDSADNKVYVYNPSWNRLSGDEFDLDSLNMDASGIAIAPDISVTFEEEQTHNRVFAYSLSGTHDSTRTFNLHEDNLHPRGIAQGDSKFWVLDEDDNKVYIYNSSTRDYDSDIDISAVSSLGGISYYDNKLWILDDSNNTILEYSTSGSLISTTSLNSLNSNPSGIVVAQDISVTFEEEQTHNRVFAYSLAGSYSSSDTFDLHDDNLNPVGITQGGNNFWVVDEGIESSPARIYYYNSTNMTYSGRFNLLTSIIPTGIIYYDGKLWVTDNSANKVFVYNTNGSRNSSDDYNLHLTNSNPTGITTAEVDVEITTKTQKVFVYMASNGTRDSSSDFDLEDDNGDPQDITFGNSHFIIVDGDDNQVYEYNSSGTYQTLFNLDSSNGDPIGIGYIDDLIWVLDGTGDEVHIYEFSGTTAPEDSFSLDSTSRTPAGLTTSGDITIGTNLPSGSTYQIRIDEKSDTESIKFYEVVMNKTLFEIPPNKLFRTITDVDSGFYTLFDGDLVPYHSLSEKGKQEYTLEWLNLSKEALEQLRDIWIGPPKKNILTMFIESGAFIDDILQMRWENDFEYSYTNPNSKIAGFTVVARFIEV